jgi:peptidyl-prolyl cis-trans isomerase B (cyclophilin B)
MKNLGSFLIIISLFGGYFAMNHDVSYDGYVNLSLMNQQSNFLFLSGVAFISGILLVGLDSKNNMGTANFSSEQHNTNNAKENVFSTEGEKIKLTTSLGDIILQLDSKNAPISTQNFLIYVNEGFYNGTIFHRVIKNFMAQGGGFDTSFMQKMVHNPIQNEATNGLKNNRGTVAMARTNVPNSATAQFFINYKDNDFLNHTGKNAGGWGYAVFGRVIDGMDIMDKIAMIPTGSYNGHQDVPKENIIIEKVEIIK